MCSIGIESAGLEPSGLADAKPAHCTVANAKNKSINMNATAAFWFIKKSMVKGWLYPFADSHEVTVFK
jgi:hypothetical protein